MRKIPLMLVWAVLCTLVLVGCNETEHDAPAPQVTTTTDNPLAEINELIKAEPSSPELYAKRAALYADLQDYQAAVNDMNRSIMLDSSVADYFALKARYLIDDRRVSDARFALAKALDRDPDNVKAHLIFSEMYMWLSDYQKAISSADKALKNDVYNARAYYLKGLAYKHLGDTLTAVSSLQTAIEQNPDFYDGYMELGFLYSIAKHPLAEDYYNNAISIRPNDVEAYYRKALFLQLTERTDDALAAYRELLRLDTTHTLAHYNVGFVYMMQTDSLEKAIPSFKHVLQLDSHYVDARYNMGYCYELLGDEGVALQEYRRVLNLVPHHTLAAKGVGRLLD